MTDRRLVRAYRMNIGTIVEAPVMRVKLGRGRSLGEIEEYFVSMLTPGDTFLFAGRLLAFEGIRNNEVVASLARNAKEPKVPAYAGGRLPLSSHLADRVRAILADPGSWNALPAPVHEWLEIQADRSLLPAADELLVESFWRSGRHFLVAYPFVGRNAHQTLGMLLTRRLERMGARPLGFVASDYCIATWSLGECQDVEALFGVDMLGDDLEEWTAESSMLKRIFRNCAVVAGLIERRQPGQEKTGRQVTFNADLIYDVLRKYEPDHVLLRAARVEAAAGLTDVRRLADFLNQVQDRIRHRKLERISPFAVSIIATIGREFVPGAGDDETLDELTSQLVAEAMGEPDPGRRSALMDAVATSLRHGDETLLLDPLGVLWLPARATLVVADLHLEKGSAFARRGTLLPPYDTARTLRRLGWAIERYRPRTVVSLGDAFHDRAGAAALDDDRPPAAASARARPRLALGARQPRPGPAGRPRRRDRGPAGDRPAAPRSSAGDGQWRRPGRDRRPPAPQGAARPRRQEGHPPLLRRRRAAAAAAGVRRLHGRPQRPRPGHQGSVPCRVRRLHARRSTGLRSRAPPSQRRPAGLAPPPA